MRGLRIASSAAIATALIVPLAARSRASLAAACVKGGRPGSCEVLAERIERGSVRPRFAEEAGLYFALACERGGRLACDRAARWAPRYPDYEALETDAGCMLEDNAFACEQFARATRDEHEEGPRGVDLRPLGRSRMRRALDLYTGACERGDAESCLGASRAYDARFGVPWSPRDARDQEAKACALGLARGCEVHGDHLSPAHAAPFYRAACDAAGGSPHGCLKYARSLEVTGADDAVVEAAYRRACERLAVDACDWLGARTHRSAP